MTKTEGHTNVNRPPHVAGVRHGLADVPRPRRGGSVRGRFMRRIAPRLLDSIQWGTLRVQLPSGVVLSGGTAEPTVDLRVVSSDFWTRIGDRGSIGFGEAFVAGDFTTSDLPTLLELLARNVELNATGRVLSTIRRLQRLRPTLTPRNVPTLARQQISYHYDLGNDFYQLLLDRTMTYSCGIYATPQTTLEDAQLAKYRAICDKLALAPGDRVLEIGCGWGGFASVAAGEYGATVTGVTISEQQHAFATQRMEHEGLSDRVTLLLQDYRTLEGEYDKIASIEMLEAVGASEYPNYFRTVDRLLAPDGSACVQVICFQDQEYARQKQTSGWIRRYIFPGGMLPSVTALSEAMTRSSRLMMHDLQEIGMHYGPTLAAWRANLAEHVDEVRDLGYDEAFLRGWDFYLAYCEAGFRTRIIRDVHLVITRAMNRHLESNVQADQPSIDSDPALA